MFIHRIILPLIFGWNWPSGYERENNLIILTISQLHSLIEGCDPLFELTNPFECIWICHNSIKLDQEKKSIYDKLEDKAIFFIRKVHQKHKLNNESSILDIFLMLYTFSWIHLTYNINSRTSLCFIQNKKFLSHCHSFCIPYQGYGLSCDYLICCITSY